MRPLDQLHQALDTAEAMLHDLKLRNRILDSTGDLKPHHTQQLADAYDRLNTIAETIDPSAGAFSVHTNQLAL